MSNRPMRMEGKACRGLVLGMALVLAALPALHAFADQSTKPSATTAAASKKSSAKIKSKVAGKPVGARASKSAASAKPRPSTTKRRVARSSDRKSSRNLLVRNAVAARQEAELFINASLSETPASPLENAGALVPFFEQLYRHSKQNAPGPVRILQFGDSHTAADVLPGELRAKFQAQFGDGGSGFVYAGRPWRGYRRFDVNIGAATGWVADNSNRWGAAGVYGMGGITVKSAGAGARMSFEVDCQSLEVFYLSQPGGGEFEILRDGDPAARVATEGELGPGYFKFEFSPGPHHFEIRTLSARPVYLIGWVAEKENGVTYETLGINGARAETFLKWDDALLEDNLSRRDPALVVVAYGTNEAGSRNWDMGQYRQVFESMLRRIRHAAPAASILVIGPPDRQYRSRNRVWTSFDRLDEVIHAQRQAAFALGCAFWDLRARMGGKDSMHRWVIAGFAQADHVHFTAGGYRLLAGVLFADIMASYRAFEILRDGWNGPENDGQTSQNTGDH